MAGVDVLRPTAERTLNSSISAPAPHATDDIRRVTWWMALRRQRAGADGESLPRPSITWPDVAICLMIMALGFVRLHDARRWGTIAYVGSAQYGDAAFWW